VIKRGEYLDFTLWRGTSSRWSIVVQLISPGDTVDRQLACCATCVAPELGTSSGSLNAR
jgi:hypothetical protein